jgi:preprotein translocase subunit SecG
MDMLALPVLNYITATLFIIICILTMLVILIQKGRGGGLSGAFGGVGGHSAFGAKTGDVFTWITVGLAAAFLVLAVCLNFVFVKLPPTAGMGSATATPQPRANTPAPPGAPVSGAPAPARPASPTPVPAAPAPAAPAPVPSTPEKPAQ